MDDASKLIYAFLGGIVAVAIVAVVVSKKSQAPAAVQSIGSAISSIVAAAVNPVSANYGYGSGSSANTSPSPAAGVPYYNPFGSMTSIIAGGYR